MRRISMILMVTVCCFSAFADEPRQFLSTAVPEGSEIREYTFRSLPDNASIGEKIDAIDQYYRNSPEFIAARRSLYQQLSEVVPAVQSEVNLSEKGSDTGSIGEKIEAIDQYYRNSPEFTATQRSLYQQLLEVVPAVQSEVNLSDKRSDTRKWDRYDFSTKRDLLESSRLEQQLQRLLKSGIRPEQVDQEIIRSLVKKREADAEQERINKQIRVLMDKWLYGEK